MAIKTECQTPGAIFHTKISAKVISCVVDLPKKLNLSEKEAKILDSNIHNAMELVLAPYFFKKKKSK